jgi:hypothetical protein
MSHFVLESSIRFSVTIKNFAGTLIDPTGLVLRLRPPVGPQIVYTYPTSPELIKDSLGTYHADHIVTEGAGEWKWKWVSTGTGAGAHGGIVRVEPD